MWNAYVFGMFKVQGLNKKFNKIEKKSKIQNFAFLEFFVILFLHTFTKLHVASVIQAQVIMQNVILNKSHFCKKLQFLTSLPNFDQNLQKKIIFQDFFVIRSIVCIFRTTFVHSKSILMILQAKIVKKTPKVPLYLVF